MKSPSGAPMAGDLSKGVAMFTLRGVRLALWSLFGRGRVVTPEVQDPFGLAFKKRVGLSLWPSWGYLEGVDVKCPDSGELSVSVFRDTDWVPLSLANLPVVAKEGLKELAKAGSEGHPIPSWAMGEQKDWRAFYEKLSAL